MFTISEPIRRRGSAVALSACLVAGLSATAVGVTAGSADAQQQVAARHLEAQLGPSGDMNGSGEATLRLWQGQGRVCATVEWRNIGRPNAAHIHRRSDGAVVVPLTGSVTGGRHCARNVSPALIGRIWAHPGRYYFNVHNVQYPAGAIKGTLHR